MQTRIVIIGWTAATTVLAIISADRLYNLSHWHLSKSYWASSRGGFSGFVIMATSNFCIMYHVGILPPAAAAPPSAPRRKSQPET